MSKNATEWQGTPPTTCDCCDCKITVAFVDGATKMGPWGMMCLGCHRTLGVGLGTGRGQKYELRGGKWMCVEGSSLPGGNVTDDAAAGLAPQRKHREPKARPPDDETESVGRLLSAKTDLAKWFRRMLAELDAVIDGPRVMREFGLTSEQVRKYCKGSPAAAKQQYIDDDNPYIEGLGWDDPPPTPSA